MFGRAKVVFLFELSTCNLVDMLSISLRGVIKVLCERSVLIGGRLVLIHETFDLVIRRLVLP